MSAVPWLGALLGVLAQSAPTAGPLVADVVVSGRTSSLGRVEVESVGQAIPASFSDGMVANSPNFAWWVSRHWALKTDCGEQNARQWLTQLELAYPHMVELFGQEPPGIEARRMAVVRGSTKAILDAAMRDDGMDRGAAGGGETLWFNRASYVYPSGALDYHLRYILIHEGTHAFHMALQGTSQFQPDWYVEGIADAMGAHVWDGERQQLTVFVRDRVPTLNHWDDALRSQRMEFLSAQEIFHWTRFERDLNVLLVHFLTDDPARLQGFRIWQEELGRLKPQGADMMEQADRLFGSTIGPWDEVNEAFRAWSQDVPNTFHYAGYAWEQEGHTLWSKVAGQSGYGQTDVYLPPGAAPEPDLFRMDYPPDEPSPLVGPVQRGVAEPAVGCVLDFSRCGECAGSVGLGLGLLEPTDCLKLLIEGRRTLVAEGLGIARQAFELPAELLAAATAGGERLGLTATLRAAEVEVELRALDPAAAEPLSFVVSLEISARQRARLLARPLTILAQQGVFGLTPHFDPGERPPVDYSQPAPPNPWRNPGDRALETLYRAAWRLGDAAPEPLLALRAALIAAATRPPPEQQRALAAYHEQLPAVVRAVESARAPAAAAGLAELSGCKLRLYGAPDGTGATGGADAVRVEVELVGPLSGTASGEVRFAVEPPAAAAALPEPERVQLRAGERLTLVRTIERAAPGARFEVLARAELAWLDASIALEARHPDQEYPGMTLRLESRPSSPEPGLELTAIFTGPRFGKAEGTLSFSRRDGDVIRPLPQTQKITLEAFQEQRFSMHLPVGHGLPAQVLAAAKLSASEEQFTLRTTLDVPAQ